MAVTIADQVLALGKTMASQPPNPAMNVFAEEQSRWDQTPLPDGVITPGTAIGDADLLDARGQPTTLHTALGVRPAVLVFYRGAWCPYCNIALNTYQAKLLPELQHLGVGLVAASPQTPDESLSLADKNALAFPILSDPGLKLAGGLGIVITPEPAVIAAQQQLCLDITHGNADGSTALPVPTTIVLDAGHVAQWVDVHPNYATRSEVPDILAAVDRLSD